MMTLDYRTGSLVTRVRGAADLEQALSQLEGGKGDVIVNLGDNLAATSWVDSFLVPLIRAVADRRVILISESPFSRREIERVLKSRAVRAAIAPDMQAVARGLMDDFPAVDQP